MLHRGESYIRHISRTVIAEYIQEKRFRAAADFSHLREMDAIALGESR
jgi:UDP-N-acetyl-D-mannosaminuronate dehydrogenase